MRDARRRLGEVVSRARTDGPQMLFLRGKRAAVILSAESYDALLALRPTIVDRLLEGPAFDDACAESVVLRAKTPSRAIKF